MQMNLKIIKKKIEEQGASFVVPIKFLNHNYAQAIKFKKNRIQYLYYKVVNDEIELIQDEKILNELHSNYEAIPSGINYANEEQQIDEDGLRKENIALRDWVKVFAGDTLAECKPFAQVYGKTFAMRKMMGLKKLYTEEESYKYAGYQHKDEITLCKKGTNGKVYSVDEIEKDEKQKQTALHEAIHLILRHDFNEATGMINRIEVIEKNKERKSTYVEIGRGLNEGLTEWITEKCGYKPKGGYKVLNNFIKELELAIGEEAVMRLGKGKDLHIILKMYNQEAKAFLSKADKVYELDKKIIELEEVNSNLSGKEETKKQKIIDEWKNKVLKKDVEFAEFISANDLEVTDESIIYYCKQKIKELQKTREEIVVDFESFLFENYFEKEFETVINSDNMTKEMIDKYKKLCSLMYKDTELIASSTEFIKKYKTLEERYAKTLQNELTKKIINKELTLSHFLELLDSAKLNDEKIMNKVQKSLVQCLAQSTSIKYSKSLVKLMESLYTNNELDELENYSIKVVETDEGEDYTLFEKNGKIISEERGYELIKVTSKNYNNYDEIFDFTIGKNEDFTKITREFDELTTRVLAQNPNSEIKIINRVIVINDGESQSYYVANNGIIPAKSIADVHVNLVKELKTIDIAQGTPTNMVPVKQTIRSKIFNFLKRRKSNYQDYDNSQESINTISYKDKREQWLNSDIKTNENLERF